MSSYLDAWPIQAPCIDPDPENRSSQNWNFRGISDQAMFRRIPGETEQIHGGAGGLCPQTGRTGHRRHRDMPQDGHLGSDLLPLEKKFGGLGSSELRRPRQLEEENRKLKQLVADLSLDKAMLQEVVAKKL